MNRRTWAKTRTARLLCLLAFAIASGGCLQRRTVLVSPGTVFRIGPEATGRIYTRQGGKWILSSDRHELPEGWYAIPPEPGDGGAER